MQDLDETIDLESTPQLPDLSRELPSGSLVNGRYEVHKQLGKGGMGEVYLVTDQVDGGPPLALKALRGGSLDADHLAMFKGEFAIMAKLRHPNLANVYSFEAMQGSADHYFTMDYVEGRTILDAVVEAPGDIERTLGLVVQVCRALSYMHRRQVIHFDLKPGNVLVTGDGDVKVLDFGLAGTRPRTAHGGLLGTPAYLAPELSIGTSAADYRVDIYSLGIMLYQLLTGRHPFPDTTLVGMLRKHCYEPLEFDPDAQQRLPAWLRELVVTLAAKQPADRPRTADVIIEAVNRGGNFSFEVETSQTKESYILSSRFVAREQQMDAITSRVEATLDGKPNSPPACFVSGVSGIGKSRLLREVRHYLQLSRHRFVETNCYEGSFAELGPIADALRHVVAIAEAAQAQDLIARHGAYLARLDPQLGRKLNIEPARMSDNAEADRMQLLEEISAFLIGVAERAAYVLYVNDLQWAMVGSTDLLAHLILTLASRSRAGTPVPLFLIGSFRDDEVNGRPVESLLDDLRTRDLLDLIALTPLSRSDVGVLLGSMLGIRSMPEAFVERVAGETAGNPFFVEEIMRTLVENQVVYLENGEWAARATIGALDIPASMANAFLRRAEHLSATERQVLDAMAVRGRPATPTLIGRMTGLAGDVVHQALAELVRRRMVLGSFEDHPTYNLAHDRMREVIYEHIDPAARRLVHERIVDALEETTTGSDKPVFDLAHHAWEAGDSERALHYALVAGDEAMREHANDLAITLFEHALQLLGGDGADDPTRREVIEKLADLAYLTGDYERATTSYSQVEAALSEPVPRARLMRKLANVHLAGGMLVQALDELWSASRMLGGVAPRGGLSFAWLVAKNLMVHLLHRFIPWTIRRSRDANRARLVELSQVYLRLSYAHFFHNPTRAILPVLLVGNTSERLGESKELCHAYSSVGAFYGSLTLFGSAAHYGEAAIAMAKRLELPWYVGQSHEFRGMSYFFMAAIDSALHNLTTAKEILRACGDMLELSVCYTHISYCHLFQGHFGRALASTEEGLEIMERTRSMQMGKSQLIHWAMARAKQGEMDRVHERMEEAVAMCRKDNDMLQLAGFEVFMGDVLLVCGEVDRAIEVFEDAREVRETHGIIQDYAAGVYAYLVRALREKMLTEADMPPPQRRQLALRCRRLSRKALGIAKLGHPNYLSPALCSRGIALWMGGRHRQAERAFARATDVARRQGTRLWLSETLFEAGRCLLEGNAAERGRGRQRLEEALQLFEEQGYVPYARRTRLLVGNAGAEDSDN